MVERCHNPVAYFHHQTLFYLSYEKNINASFHDIAPDFMVLRVTGPGAHPLR